ncbi:MAG: hypothetical protein D6788_10645 [Planctomycetota bacterium]|nr:MAG: hypothetical protein D6788_10645 [Planctomycetota bacterium]
MGNIVQETEQGELYFSQRTLWIEPAQEEGAGFREEHHRQLDGRYPQPFVPFGSLRRRRQHGDQVHAFFVPESARDGMNVAEVVASKIKIESCFEVGDDLRQPPFLLSLRHAFGIRVRD